MAPMNSDPEDGGEGNRSRKMHIFLRLKLGKIHWIIQDDYG